MRSNISLCAAALAAATLVLSACGGDESGKGAGGGPVLDASQARALFANDLVAAGAAPRAELVALGRQLYHDQRISKNGNLSCASCHDLARFGQDNLPTSPGSTGERGGRSSPPSVNASRQIAQFWDGRARDVEAQAQGPVLNPIEHGVADEAALVAILSGIDEYRTAFAAAFPDAEKPITLANFGAAVGAFERTLRTHSRVDDFLDGRDDALTPAEKTGFATFMATGCASCHNYRTFGGGQFRKLGEVHAYQTEDRGVGALAGKQGQDFFFKVPMLLNVAATAPYFHDGSVATLEKAIELMAWHQLGKKLSADEIQSIATFLKALTGQLVQ
ncbi:MAG: c-type cytochrome [Planctomycetes bacterium]|nr:c-type cytochrome [Planctomycetota bacterium]